MLTALQVTGRALALWWRNLGQLTLFNVAWLALQVPIVTGPPATAAMFVIARRVADGELLSLRDGLAAFKQLWWPAWRWGLVNLSLGVALVGNFSAYQSTPGWGWAALRAVWTVQKQIAARGEPPLSLKVGIHHGPCIVVNLNDRLDYFGSTVNIAARLPNFSTGGEAIISESIRNDQEVIEFLEKNAPPNSLTRFQGDIRGYDQSMDLWRIQMQ